MSWGSTLEAKNKSSFKLIINNLWPRGWVRKIWIYNDLHPQTQSYFKLMTQTTSSYLSVTFPLKWPRQWSHSIKHLQTDEICRVLYVKIIWQIGLVPVEALSESRIRSGVVRLSDRIRNTSLKQVNATFFGWKKKKEKLRIVTLFLWAFSFRWPQSQDFNTLNLSQMC